MAASTFLLLLVAVAIAAPWLAPYDPLDQDLRNTLSSPTWSHLLGTDHLGRDLLSRLIAASRVSLSAAAQATAAAVVFGVPVGLVAGYMGGWWDRIIMRGTDIVMSLPGIILVISIVAVLGNNLRNAMIALGIVFAPPLVRLTRGAALSVREENYVDAAHVMGLPKRLVMQRHILPNVAAPIMVHIVLTFGFALLVEAGLAFLGLGVQPPAASWGKMLTEASQYMGHQTLGVFPPGIVITLTVLAVNFLGDGLRDSVGRGVTTPQKRAPRRPASGLTSVGAGTPGASSKGIAPQTWGGASLLELRSLTVRFPSERGDEMIPVVDRVNLAIAPGEIVGLVGESGSGKTMTALSIMGLVPSVADVSGEVIFGGRDLTELSPREIRDIRGRDVAMVFQEPVGSLDPVFTVGHQIAEPLRRHLGLSRSAARRRAIELLDRVGLPDPQQRVDHYPHQFSGGMAQRVMIAAALSCRPKLLIADEPTTALDVTTQAEILELLRELQEEFGMAVLIITHDLGVIADICERTVVMYAGEVVETGDLETLFAHPLHPYTAALLRAAPLSTGMGAEGLAVIPGSIPQPGERPEGCRFHPRCDYAIESCRVAPPALRLVGGRETRCIRSEELRLTGSSVSVDLRDM